MKEIISKIDCRSSPRIKTEPSLVLRFPEDNIVAKTIDISDKGLCFSIPKPLIAKEHWLIVEFPSASVSLNTQIRWTKHVHTDNGILYGASLINADSKALTTIKRYMVSKQFRHTVKDIKNKLIRKEVLKVAKSFRDYLFKLVELADLLEHKKIDKEDLRQKLIFYNDEIVRKGDELKECINDKLIIDKLKNDFRSLVSSWAYKSQIMKRGLDKPKGYPGDYKTLEVIYDKETFSTDEELGYYFDMYFLDNPYAEAVRNRKDKLREILRKFLEERDETKVLNLACGSCREIRELFEREDETLQKKNMSFSCLDWDEDALNFSKNKLKSLLDNVKLKFIKENVLNFVKNGKFFEENGKQDLTYSIGLADYLPDRVLKKMIKNLFDGLNKNGAFILAHKDKDISFSHLPPEWFCDWVFVSRNEKDLLNLIEEAGINNYSHSIEREKSGQIFFITITKQ